MPAPVRVWSLAACGSQAVRSNSSSAGESPRQPRALPAVLIPLPTNEDVITARSKASRTDPALGREKKVLLSKPLTSEAPAGVRGHRSYLGRQPQLGRGGGS